MRPWIRVQGGHPHVYRLAIAPGGAVNTLCVSGEYMTLNVDAE